MATNLALNKVSEADNEDRPELLLGTRHVYTHEELKRNLEMTAKEIGFSDAEISELVSYYSCKTKVEKS